MLYLSNNYIFSSFKSWEKKRERTIFKSLEDVINYQNKKISFIKKHHENNGLENFEYTNKVPNLNVDYKEFFKMTRSGTTSLNSDRSYFYSLNQKILDAHHFWKIERLNNIEKPGNVVWIAATDYGQADQSGFILGSPSKNRIKLIDQKYYNVGFENKVYELLYDYRFSKDHWRYNLEIIKNMDVKFLRTSPSVIQTLYYYFKDEYFFDFPVVLSEETLHDEVRTMAEFMFSKVIDKCVAWDGCLGWFECCCGTKHIYDEFCRIKQLDHNVLAVTDLNNFACPFFNYINGDKGVVGTIDCDCGLSGYYFKSFEGKIVESIYIDENKFLPGRYVYEKLSKLFKGDYSSSNDFALLENSITNFEETFPADFVFKILQKENLQIDFTYFCKGDLSSSQIEFIRNYLNIILWRNSNCKKINFIKEFEIFKKNNRRDKVLMVRSDYLSRF